MQPASVRQAGERVEVVQETSGTPFLVERSAEQAEFIVRAASRGGGGREAREPSHSRRRDSPVERSIENLVRAGLEGDVRLDARRADREHRRVRRPAPLGDNLPKWALLVA